MYWPPVAGQAPPSSAQASAPKKVAAPAKVQTPTISGMEPRLCATRLGTRKMPPPMMIPMTMATESARPSRRGRSCDIPTSLADADGAHVADDGGGDGLELGPAELEAHAAADEASLDHRAAPGGAVDLDERRLGAKDRMAGNERAPHALVSHGIRAILGLD